MKDYIDSLRRRTTIGLSIGSAALHAVRLARNSRGLWTARATDVSFPVDRAPHPAEIELAVQQAVGTGRNERTRICAGLPPHEAGLHLFQLPFESPEKVRQVLTYEAEPLFLTPAEELTLDFAPLTHPKTSKPLGAVFGARPEIVESFAGELKSAGTDPDYILPEQLALLAVGRFLIESDPESGPLVLIDLGASHTSLAVFENRRPVLIRSVFYGGRDVSRKLADASQIDLYEAEQIKIGLDVTRQDSMAGLAAWQPLLIEVERSLTVLAGGPENGRPRIVLGGGGARTPGLIQYMENTFGAEISSFDRIAAIRGLGSGLSPESMTPLGLALLPLQPGYLPNLRGDDRSAVRIWQKYRAPIAALIAGLIILGGLAFGHLYLGYSRQRDRFQAAKTEINRLFRETAPQITQIISPVEQLRQEIQKAARAGQSGPGGGRILDILLDVSRLAGAHEGLRITDLAVNPETVELQGEGGSFETVEKLKSELAALPHFSGATGGGGRKDPNTNVLSFKITLRRSMP